MGWIMMAASAQHDVTAIMKVMYVWDTDRIWVARAGHGQLYPKVFRLCKSVGIAFGEQCGLVVLPSAFIVNMGHRVTSIKINTFE